MYTRPNPPSPSKLSDRKFLVAEASSRNVNVWAAKFPLPTSLLGVGSCELFIIDSSQKTFGPASISFFKKILIGCRKDHFVLLMRINLQFFSVA